jgi:hypothetical protein
MQPHLNYQEPLSLLLLMISDNIQVLVLACLDPYTLLRYYYKIQQHLNYPEPSFLGLLMISDSIP